MKIGNLEVSGYAALAPMAGVADRAMRELCISYGASFCISELVSSKGVSMGDRKSKELMSVYEKERPMAVQLFGCEPDIMASAAKIAASQNPDFLDINMGCPAPKVAGNGGGSALMKDPVLAGDIVKAVVSATELPVTVKIRTGWDENNITALEVAKRCEDAGAAAVTVHGRTRTQMYAPPVNLDIIKSVKEALAIPVIANGDIDTPEKAKAVYEYTGCDFLMVGRAAMGAPWIFSQINAYLKDGTILPEPSLEEKLNTLLLQVKMMAEYKNERTAILESRKHASWYLKGMRGAAAFRRMCGEIDSFTDLEKLCNSVKEMQNNA
ncbi:MAG: tRNA dihydrouridine synthase DusB [Acutalibacteraceae bacterium]|nr:tRNA dihydrouridine synthase DusB [Acutalibacteraceae bacterium]